MTATKLDQFTIAYIECALWSTMDESDERGGEPLDKNYGVDDIAPESLESMVRDCAAFQAANPDDILTCLRSSVRHNQPSYHPLAMAGHDFWLTRNGHGAGFFDGDYPVEEGNRLTRASKAFGEANLYVGDDGRIYAS